MWAAKFFGDFFCARYFSRKYTGSKMFPSIFLAVCAVALGFRDRGFPCSQFQCFPPFAWIRNYLIALQREVGRSRWERGSGSMGDLVFGH